jgi:hypothetical protein
VRLNLKYDPTVANAPLFAADIAASAKDISGVDWDYSVESLKAVDDIIDGFHRDGLEPGQIGETLFGFGCYVGEVFVRNAGASWKFDPKKTPVFGFPLVIQTGPDKLCNPIGKVFKRLKNGIEDNLPYFYDVFTKPDATSPK